MIDFKSIIENLKEMNDYYEQHLSDIDRYLEKKGLLEDYHEFEKRHSEEKKRQDNKETAEKIADQKTEEEKKAEEERIEEEKAETEDKESEEAVKK